MYNAFTCFLLDAAGILAGPRDFFANSERDAVAVSRALLCKNALPGFELWSGNLLICMDMGFWQKS
jgi:hypothetical protein